MSNPNMTRVSWKAVCARRLERHGLAQPVPAEQLARQVGVMCGAHAQIMSAAEMSIALRVEGITRKQIQDALWAEHALIKTYGPRGTVHLLSAGDLPIWTGAFTAMPANRKIELLTPEQIEAVIEAIDTALSDAELTIDELTEAIVSIAGSWAGERVMDAFQDKWPRWREVTNIAANRGVLCFGPQKGRNITYTCRTFNPPTPKPPWPLSSNAISTPMARRRPRHSPNG